MTAIEQYANSAYSTLATTISAGDTSLTVASGHGARFPSTGNFRVRLDNEIMLCTSRTGDVLTVTRGQESTSGASHTAGVAVNHVLTRGALLAMFKGPAGDKPLLVQDTAGDTAFSIDILGGGGADTNVLGAYFPETTKLVVGNVRNWSSASDFFVTRTRLTAGQSGSFVPAILQYHAAVQPTDGFNGSTLVPDEAVMSVVAFAYNIAGGGAVNHDGTMRAAEFQNIVYASTGLTRTMSTLEVGIHTAAAKLSILDSVTPDTTYGDIAVLAISQDQPYTGYGTGQRANGAFWAIGGKGYKHPFAALDVDNSTLWYLDSGGSMVQKGNHYWFGVGARLKGDFTNATIASRVMFEAATANSPSSVGVKPSGSGNEARWSAWARHDVDNSEFAYLSATSASGFAALNTSKSGSATAPGINIGANALTILQCLITGIGDLTGGLARSGRISPSQLVANTNDWNPTGLATAGTIRVSTDASRDLTGIVPPVGFFQVTILNVGTQNLVLKHESASSSATNRFNLPGGSDVTLGVHTAATLWYDTSRWKQVA